jgi:exonuclease III
MDNTSKSNTILQWNIRSLSSNLIDLQILIDQYSPIAICLQETLLKSTKIINLRQYEHFFKTNVARDGRPIGGTSILINKIIPHSPISLVSELQVVAVRVTLHRTFTLCSIYLPPSDAIDINDLNSLIAQLPSPIILMGDFNAHSPFWGCDNHDNKGYIIEKFITDNDLFLLNNKSKTYIHPASGTKTAIDLTLCHPMLATDFAWSVIHDPHGSDHLPIIIEYKKPLPETKVTKWKLLKADWHTFQSQCENNLNLQSITPITNNVESFTAKLLDIVEHTVPKTKSKPKRISKPWFTDECKTAISHRQNFFENFWTSPTPENKLQFQKARAYARYIVKQNKKLSWQNFVSKLNNRTTSKKVWDMIRKIKGNPSPLTIKHLQYNNIMVTQPEDICNVLAQNFARNSSTAHYSLIFQNFKRNQESHNINFNSSCNEYYNVPFTISEIDNAISNAHNSSPGMDNVHYEFLKQLPSVTRLLLLNVFNNIWINHTFPVSWRQAIVIPIPKPSKDHTNPDNYRPIALTSCICKILESMVNKRLVFYLETNNLISSYQCGFRKQKSTIDHLVRFENFVREGFINNDHVVAIFFDLEKAYDTTWKFGILQDLFNIGLRGHLPIFISNFLSLRQFIVKTNLAVSDVFEQECGVPQGCILSTTLFNLKINSITKCIPVGIEQFLFVDDFSICCRSKQMNCIERRMQLALNNFANMMQ